MENTCSLYQQLLNDVAAARQRAIHAALDRAERRAEARALMVDFLRDAGVIEGAPPMRDFTLDYGVNLYGGASLGVIPTPRAFAWRYGEHAGTLWLGRRAPLLHLAHLTDGWAWMVYDQWGRYRVPPWNVGDVRAWCIEGVQDALTSAKNFVSADGIARAGRVRWVDVDWASFALRTDPAPVALPAAIPVAWPLPAEVA